MKRFRHIQLIIIGLFLIVAGDSHAQNAGRERIKIDRDWKFSLGHAADPAKDYNFKVANIFSKSGKAVDTAIDPKFDDSDWRTLNLPHDWAVELPFVYKDNFDLMAHGYRPVGGLFPENSVGWYRKEIEVSKLDSGRHLSLTFDGIYRDALIWINGYYLGNIKSGYIGDSFDITNYVNFGGKNIVVVRVDASQYEGWFYEGAGIYQHVWLNKYDNLHLNPEGVFAYSKIDKGRAEVKLEASISNESLQPSSGSVVFTITNRDGEAIAESQPIEVSFAINETATVSTQLNVENPILWSLENPYLYRVKCTLTQGENTIDTMTERIGLRTIVVDPVRGLLLNGKSVKIQGVNNHNDHAGLGSALPDHMHFYRVKLLQELGVNAYRTSHNPPAPKLLEACDSLGMLVMDETRLLNTSPEYMEQFERMIKRDRNHPSIFMWSIGNEEGYVHMNSVGTRLALTMLAKQVELDPSRISTYAADVGNEFKGINTVIPVRSFNYREEHMVAYHNDHPEQPILGTEMGSTVTTRGIYAVDSVKGYLTDQDINFPWWASRAEDWWPIAAENDWLLGGFVWTGFDYRGEPTPFQWPNISSHFGIMDVCGFPKNIYYYYQSWWTDKDVLHISPHWNWSGDEGEVKDVWVNSNAETVELFLNNKSLGKQDMARNGHLQWQVPYKKGTLKAVGIKNGRKIVTEVKTTGEASKLVLTADRKNILADGEDVVVINVTVTDKKGQEVPTANHKIEFKLIGPGKIIGVGNGDPSSHEADKHLDGNYSRSLFNGKCQIIVQAGMAIGEIEITAVSDGLESQQLVVGLYK